MRRDMEYCRLLLIDLSKGKFNRSIPRNEDGEKYKYHLELLESAGLVSLEFVQPSSFGYHLKEIPKLTWEGNDFLDAIENDTIWENTKSFAKSKGFEVAKLSFEILKEIAIGQGKKMLGIE
ncbi:DUF2513 domain-containing protein [Rummeliibacillus sp. TYF-LIM-RU47]|uniref:DUF2513 domain-containing protein n=1 Tax=Rummeliibacillus sp. TYF-LIM-RU47 TaxID=2608406 RepID=UPI00123A88BB|nr:DUF2513 domain-containing protein [Rummeliibacillus sp. TYF-LIM-RU47]